MHYHQILDALSLVSYHDIFNPSNVSPWCVVQPMFDSVLLSLLLLPSNWAMISLAVGIQLLLMCPESFVAFTVGAYLGPIVSGVVKPLSIYSF